MKVLIIEPSRSFQKILSFQFGECGVEATMTDAVTQAMSFMVAEGFDFICVARYLNGLDGVKLCQKIRDEVDRETRIILVTSSDESEICEECIDYVCSKSDLQALGGYLQEEVSKKKQVGGRVLYVEDSESVAFMMKGILQHAGIYFDHFTTAEEAWEIYQKKDYDLILSDIYLAGEMSGFDLIRKVRESEAVEAHVPILVVSAQSEPKQKVELLKSGANDYVPKPFIQDEVVARVKNLITMKHLTDKIRGQREMLRKMALTDQLTHLYNRHYLMEEAPKLIRRYQEEGKYLSLLVVDIDHFKRINDEHGHITGDAVLMQVATLLDTNRNEEEITARFGGEEFVMILPECSLDEAGQRANQLREAIHELRPERLEVTASFGVASLGQNDTFRGLFSGADEAVYASKEAGRNCVTVKKGEEMLRV